MVHAYDFNMELPSTPSQSQTKGMPEFLGSTTQPNSFGLLSCDSGNVNNQDDSSHNRNVKRRRSSVNSGRESPRKIPHIEPPTSDPVVVETGCQIQPLQCPPSPHTARPLTPQHGGSHPQADGALDYFSHGIPAAQAYAGIPGMSYDAVGKVVLNCRPPQPELRGAAASFSDGVHSHAAP